MKYEAVIFDLGGTLVPYVPQAEFLNQAKKMASVLSVPEEEFSRLWFSQSGGLGIGEFNSYQDFIRHICNQLGISIKDDLVRIAASIPYNMMQRMITYPRDDAIEVLSHLGGNGYRLGLLSDCGPDVPEIWKQTPFVPYFDVTVFSCLVGINKSDPRIFQLILDEMDVESSNCLFVADGFRQELANAWSLGVHSIQMRVPDEIDDDPLREDWTGVSISSLTEILDLLE